jgi:multicomponent Na+:H+ antiporter subunit G
MNMLQDISSWVLLISGSLVLITGAVGMIRLPDFYTRLHAASVIDTLGCMLIASGLVLQAGFTIVAVKLVLIVIFILFTSPAAAHALAKAALHGELRPWIHKPGESKS